MLATFEQTVFLRRLVVHQLLVSERAMIEARSSMSAPWGRLGSSRQDRHCLYPKKPDGTLDEARGLGWYVGSAVKNRRA